MSEESGGTRVCNAPAGCVPSAEPAMSCKQSENKPCLSAMLWCGCPLLPLALLSLAAPVTAGSQRATSEPGVRPLPSGGAGMMGVGSGRNASAFPDELIWKWKGRAELR